jgi:VanZ family protein
LRGKRDKEQSPPSVSAAIGETSAKFDASAFWANRRSRKNPLVRRFPVIEGQVMQARLVTSLRVLTWCGIIFVAVLSLLPGKALRALSLLPVMKSARTILPGPLEHFVVYAAVAAIAMAGYGSRLGGPRIIAAFCVYASTLEYMRHFSPGRHPSIAKFAGSALGALCGGLVLILLLRRYFKQPS